MWYKIIKWWQNNSLENKWIRKYSGILSVLVLVYIILHTTSIIDECKRQKVSLTQAQIEFITGIGNNDSIQRKDTIIRQFLVNSGYSNRQDIESILSGVEVLSTTELNLYLKSYSFEEDSPFWLTGYYTFIEISFWSLFGVLSSLLFHGTEAIRRGEFDQREQSVHWAKLMYSPLVTIILILSIEALTEGGDINLDGLSYWLIVLSFIFGFFSRKSIDLLDRLKEIIFRSSDKQSEPVSSEELNFFENLNDQAQKDLLEEAKETKMVEWSVLYEGIQSVTVGQKEKDGVATSYNCLKFQVDLKRDKMVLKDPIPATIPYTARDGNLYYLPTDIEETGQTEDDGYKSGQPQIVCTNNIKPGCSIGRGKSTDPYKNTGTLGLKVQKLDDSSKSYMLSCFHVICSKELREKKFEVDGDAVQKDVFAPGSADGAGNILANVSEGYLNSSLDVAIAEILNSNDVGSIIHSIPNAPSGTREIKKEDENNLLVKMSGRSSNLQIGKVIDHWTFTKIKYDSMTEKHTIHGVIMTSKISTKGDSGAAVVDKFGDVIGILVSSNTKYSYVIPIQRILNKLKIEICTS